MTARYVRGGGRGPIWNRRGISRKVVDGHAPSPAMAAAKTTGEVIAVLRSRALPLEHRADLIVGLVKDSNGGSDQAGNALVDQMTGTIVEFAAHCAKVYGADIEELVQAGRRAVVGAARELPEATNPGVVLKVLKREIYRVVRKAARRHEAYCSRTVLLAEANPQLGAGAVVGGHDADAHSDGIDRLTSMETPASFSGTPESTAAARECLSSLTPEEGELLFSVVLKEEPVVSWVRRHFPGLGPRAVRRKVSDTVRRVDALCARLRLGRVIR